MVSDPRPASMRMCLAIADCGLTGAMFAVSSAPPIEAQRLQRALERATAALLEARNPEGHWTGELSSSALSTATAVTALAVVARQSEIRNPKSSAVLPGSEPTPTPMAGGGTRRRA